MLRHIQERHPRNAVAADDLNKFRETVTITITEEEETKMGIPEKQGRSVIAYDSYDARRMNHLPTVQNIQEDSPRRPRQAPFSHVPPQPFHLPIPQHLQSYNSTATSISASSTDPFR